MSDQGFDDNNLEFGEGEAEECGVEGDRETTSSSPSEEMPIDRLSELPDLLLIHILSFLGVKRAVVTSVLSKRWNGLWAELPRLEFWEYDWTKKTREFVSWVNRTLAIRKGDYLEKFLVKVFDYDESFDSDVDAWVEYSVKNEAKELNLMLSSYDYKPPQMMYSCSSLTDLLLSGCIMAYEGAIAWKSLTRLSLYDVGVNQHIIDEILYSGCPVLKRLDVHGCWGFSRLTANSRCLDHLRVKAPLLSPYLEISAPYVCYLDVDLCPGEWQLTDISSAVDAKIELSDLRRGLLSEELMNNAKEFLEKFKHVKKLYIWNKCFEHLSVMAMKGWQLPQFMLRDLTLVSDSEYKHSISGIIAMLDSSPNIETLHLDGLEIVYIVGYEKEEYTLDPATKTDLNDDLFHLKKIRVDNFVNPNGEPLLTLVRILLRRAPALEEMTIVIYTADPGDFINIAQTLLSYSRSSTKAKIYLKKSPKINLN